MDIIKVAAKSEPRRVAGCIASLIRGQSNVTVQAIGAAAVNQAVKAATIAREFLMLDGLDITLVPTFTSVMIGDQEKTAIRFIVMAKS